MQQNTMEALASLARALSKGSQANINLETIGDDIAFISKNIITPIPASELQSFVDAVLVYHQEFLNQDLDFRVPQIASAQLVSAENGNAIPYINTREQFIHGHDIDDILKSPELQIEMKLQLWQGYISALLSLYNGANQATVAVDAKPANFMFASGEFFYIDFFPPLTRNADGLITPFHQGIFKRDIYLMSFNFGDMRGILTKLLALTRIDYPELSEILIQQALATLESCLSPIDPLYMYVEQQVRAGFPDMNLFYSGESQTARARLQELLQL